MAITEKTIKELANKPAVLCCRAVAGIVITAANLEDPTLFDDLADSGLLTLPDDCLTIEQVIGAKLTKTLDSLTPLTPDVVEGLKRLTTEKSPTPQATTSIPLLAGENEQLTTGGVLKLNIEEGRGINLEIPLSALGLAPVVTTNPQPTVEAIHAKPQAAREVRSVRQRYFDIKEVKFGDETKIEGAVLTLRHAADLCEAAALQVELVKEVSIKIITPQDYDTYSETIMDVQPIATKEAGEVGEGVTRMLNGVVILLTGIDASGVQIGEFGSSEGELTSNIMWDRPGAPDTGDILIKIEVVIETGANMERPGPLAAHRAADYITEEIRQALKAVDQSLATATKEITQYRRTGNKKVVLIKEIMGQGAMHDNLILPMEPAGIVGAKANVDLGNLPVMLAPTEVLDGAIHALTCIGPASKENTRHYFREPLVIETMADEELDLVGVIFVGSPQANSEKFYVSKRLGMLIEAMEIDGAIVTTEGFGNNHIDFASHIEEIGKRAVSVVGMTYSAVQGALVVGNKYMDALIDNNKSKQGIENEILANNTLCQEDAIRALAMLKAKMAGATIKPAERKWHPNVKRNNIEAIEYASGTKITLTTNEQALPKSKKRQELYEKSAP